jgi:hypothetical protein
MLDRAVPQLRGRASGRTVLRVVPANGLGSTRHRPYGWANSARELRKTLISRFSRIGPLGNPLRVPIRSTASSFHPFMISAVHCGSHDSPNQRSACNDKRQLDEHRSTPQSMHVGNTCTHRAYEFHGERISNS